MAQFFLDNFTDANGTSLGAHTSDSGHDWFVHPTFSPTAPASIHGNRAIGSATTTIWYSDAEPATDNYSVFAKLDRISVTTILTGIVGRMDPAASTGYFLRRNDSTIELTKLVAGAITTLGTVARAQENCIVELSMLGPNLNCYVQEVASGNYVKSDGTTQVARVACITASDSAITAKGVIGVSLANSTTLTRTHIDWVSGEQAEALTASASDSIGFSSTGEAIARRRPLVFIGNRISRLPEGDEIHGAPESLSGGSEFLEVTLTDTGDATYYYYGGLDSAGDWKINRYLKADVVQKSSATESNNGSYVTLATAWTDRGSLTYA